MLLYGVFVALLILSYFIGYYIGIDRTFTYVVEDLEENGYKVYLREDPIDGVPRLNAIPKYDQSWYKARFKEGNS